jgi:hypothetical protein
MRSETSELTFHVGIQRFNEFADHKADPEKARNAACFVVVLRCVML